MCMHTTLNLARGSRARIYARECSDFKCTHARITYIHTYIWCVVIACVIALAVVHRAGTGTPASYLRCMLINSPAIRQYVVVDAARWLRPTMSAIHVSCVSCTQLNQSPCWAGSGCTIGFRYARNINSRLFTRQGSGGAR